MGGKQFDLENRTKCFAKSCRDLLPYIPHSIANNEYTKQLVRSSGSVAANYIEANESVSRKDYFYRVKLCKKEAKETILWLELIDAKRDVHHLIQEATELMRIFGAIITKQPKKL